MINLFRGISGYLKKNPNKTLINFIPEFNKNLNPIDITILNNVAETTIKKQIIFRNKDFELLKIDWGPKSSTIIYDNPNKGSIINLLNGNLIEKKITNKKEVLDNLQSNNTLYIQNKLGKHNLLNPNNKSVTSIILHSY